MLRLLLLLPFFAYSGTIVGFSPSTSAIDAVISHIERSQSTLDIAAYSFTSKQIALAVVEAKKRGVKVRVLADRGSNRGRYTAVTYLKNHGVKTRLNGKYAIMHNKVIISDKKSVLTGSFNFTDGAIKRNAENVIITDDRTAVKAYAKEFERLWKEGE